jgi:hypothetical protein
LQQKNAEARDRAARRLSVLCRRGTKQQPLRPLRRRSRSGTDLGSDKTMTDSGS